METPNLSSCTTSIWNYDVFLSFRGDDTRFKFTDHLYHALCRIGINTFRDEEELRTGDEIRPALLKAIGGSRILIIVFSVSYASSSWCLDELVRIFKCKKEKKQVVFPIFYEVDPSEVRHQSGRFGDAMVKHEKRYRDNIQKVENWKSALRKAANVSGESYKKGMSESQFIDKIIMKILSILDFPLSHLQEQAVRLGSRRLHVVSLPSIKSNDPDVSMVGIYGIGGVWKTTRKVYRYLKGFDGVEDCKTSKVVVKGEKADPVKVVERVQRKSHRQGELISPIPKPPPPVEEEEDAEDKPKPEDKKEEPQVITVVLKVWMHCEACPMNIKKQILRMKGVESAGPDLKTSLVTVKGIFDPPKLVDYVYKRTNKKAVIVKQEPEKKKEGEEDKGKEPSKEEEEKKNKKEKEEECDKEKKEGGEEEDDKEEKKEGEEDKGKEPSKEEEEGDKEKKEDGGPPLETTSTVVEVKRNEYQYYPQRNPPLEIMYYAYPPQIFSDENPNACTVM